MESFKVEVQADDVPRRDQRPEVNIEAINLAVGESQAVSIGRHPGRAA